MNKQITEDYCSFEIAKLLKEKGFDEPCCSCYLLLDKSGYTEIEMCDECHQGERYDSEDSSWKFGTLLLRPTHQMAMAWLREVHRIETHIVLSELNTDNSRKYMFDIYSSDINRDFDSVQKEGFNSYEEAVEAALLYILKNLI